MLSPHTTTTVPPDKEELLSPRASGDDATHAQSTNMHEARHVRSIIIYISYSNLVTSQRSLLSFYTEGKTYREGMAIVNMTALKMSLALNFTKMVAV